ncbi:uncharacterized protein LOC115680160 [Syzygium oleosum]|uniref:uncharacterized protein LOC115680160 n=1 Tax=Syzygium oleosum TaxID=219896 RepID=UPI0024B8AF46|nr:uncharacterized protein LOC115680160 [Syzygium oleosum]
MCRRHYLEFPSAALDRNYIKLLSSVRRLLELSQSSFPSSTETTFCTLQQSGFENSQMTQESNNLSQLEALPHPRPAAAADSALHLRDHLNSPHVGVAGAPTLQSTAIMRNTQRHFVFHQDPIGWYHLRLPPAINSTFTSLIGSSSAIGSAINDDAMGVQQEHDGYANNRGKFIGPSEQNETFTSPIGSSSAVGSASNDDAMGVQQEHDGYANNRGKFISPSEPNETLTSPTGSSSAGASGSNGDAMDETETRWMLTVTGNSTFGPPVSQGQTYEQLASLMRHQSL